MPTRLYPPDDPTAKVGIPRGGELFTAEDARRLVGSGLASRKDPRKRRADPRDASSSSRRVAPAKEG